MNPFDLTGPPFLVFYVAVAVVVNLAYRMAMRGESGSDMQGVTLHDPYQIAYLRGGKDEALRVTVVSLADRGLLKATGADVIAASGAIDLVRRPIERAVLEFFATGVRATRIFTSTSAAIAAATGAYKDELERNGLLPDDATRRARGLGLLMALAVLLIVTIIKIDVALHRGHHNLGFLILLTIVACGIAVGASRKRRTTAGDSVLGKIKAESAGLKARVALLSPGGASQEAALFAAVFGVAALPISVFPFVPQLFPKSRSDNTSSSGGCGGGGCGGGGSDGGGGGCGGGCGGCGG